MAASLATSAVARRSHARQRRLAVAFPAHRLVRHAQVVEDLLVEAAGAIQQLLHFAQEQARLRALYDAVVVSAGEGHDLADSQNGARLRGRALVFGRIADGAGGDDGALARHEPRIGSHGAHRARIGEGDGGSLKIGRRQLVRARPGDQAIERGQVLLEAQRAGVLDVRNHQVARAVLAGHIHRDSQVDAMPHHAEALPLALRIRAIERGHLFERLDDGPADNVRVGDLAAPQQRQVLIDDAPVFVHHLDGDGALRSGQRNGHAGGHVLGDPPGRPAQGLKLLVAGNANLRIGDLSDFAANACSPRAVALVEHGLPALVHRRVVAQILAV